MVTLPAAMLRTILESPADDRPRLVAADWLDEHGDGDRAEFIRVQVELAGLVRAECKLECRSEGPPGPIWCTACGHDPKCCNCDLTDRWNALLRREWELLATHESAWLEAVPEPEWLPAYATNWVWYRGFVSSVTCTAAVWLAHGPSLVWRPGREVACPRCGGRWPKSGGDPYHPSPCLICRGVGCFPRPVPPGAHPLSRVTLSDQPLQHWPGGGWGWYCYDGDHYSRQYRHEYLPRSLFGRLSGGAGDQNWRHYPTEQAALDAMSEACLEWAAGEPVREGVTR